MKLRDLRVSSHSRLSDHGSNLLHLWAKISWPPSKFLAEQAYEDVSPAFSWKGLRPWRKGGADCTRQDVHAADTIVQPTPSTGPNSDPEFEWDSSLEEILEQLDADPFARQAEEDQIAELTRWTQASVTSMTLPRFLELASHRYPFVADTMIVGIFRGLSPTADIPDRTARVQPQRRQSRTTNASEDRTPDYHSYADTHCHRGRDPDRQR